MDPSTTDAAELYIDLLKKTLTRYAFPEHYRSLNPQARSRAAASMLLGAIIRPLGLEVVRPVQIDLETRATGRDWPPEAETMIGLRRLDNIQSCVESILADGIRGDLIETGVWRGGATIFMRALLRVSAVDDRIVWVADSFEGLPPPDPDHHADAGDKHHQKTELVVSLEEVQDNFRRYGMLDDNVRFLKGWFADTLPRAPISRLALLRLDGDMFGSTIVALEALYPKVQPGGFVIVDDYQLEGARTAVDSFRNENKIADPLVDIDGEAVFWRRSGIEPAV